MPQNLPRALQQARPTRASRFALSMGLKVIKLYAIVHSDISLCQTRLNRPLNNPRQGRLFSTTLGIKTRHDYLQVIPRLSVSGARRLSFGWVFPPVLMSVNRPRFSPPHRIDQTIPDPVLNSTYAIHRSPPCLLQMSRPQDGRLPCYHTLILPHDTTMKPLTPLIFLLPLPPILATTLSLSPTPSKTHKLLPRFPRNTFPSTLPPLSSAPSASPTPIRPAHEMVDWASVRSRLVAGGMVKGKAGSGSGPIAVGSVSLKERKTSTEAVSSEPPASTESVSTEPASTEPPASSKAPEPSSTRTIDPAKVDFQDNFPRR